jgi:hypothetical protein
MSGERATTIPDLPETSGSVSLDAGSTVLDLAEPNVKRLLSHLANMLVADVARDLAPVRNDVGRESPTE